MSRVTNIILSVQFSEDGGGFSMWLAEINVWLEANNQPPLELLEPPAYSGSKMLEVNLCVGAYNHLNVQGFIDCVRGIQWTEPQFVQLFVQMQEDDCFTEMMRGVTP